MVFKKKKTIEEIKANLEPTSEKPEEVKEKPEEVKEKPGEVKETPVEVKETPVEVSEDVKENLGGTNEDIENDDEDEDPIDNIEPISKESKETMVDEQIIEKIKEDTSTDDLEDKVNALSDEDREKLISEIQQRQEANRVEQLRVQEQQKQYEAHIQQEVDKRQAQKEAEKPRKVLSDFTVEPSVKGDVETVKIIKGGDSVSLIWKLLTGLFAFSSFGLLGGMMLFKGEYVWMGGTFVFMALFLLMFIFVIFLGKKTHAVLEFKALMTGKPISLFFTDHKRVDWKVIEPEGNILVDKQYGAFLINEKGAYVDKKTKNVFLAFNPAIGSNASIESFKIADTLTKVLRDEKYLAEIREALMSGELDGDEIVFKVNGEEQRLKRFEKLKENVDFSHLKSLLNTLIPHAINSKIEMTVQQRLSGNKQINTAQIILVAVAIIGAAAFAIMMLNIYGGGGGTTTVVKEVAAPAMKTAASAVTTGSLVVG